MNLTSTLHVAAERPIASSVEDLLDRSWFSDALARFAETEGPPAAVAIIGERGSGKTSTLNLIRSGLSPGFLCVSFNAWKNECGRDTGRALLRATLAGLAEDEREKRLVTAVLEDLGEKEALGIELFEESFARFVRERLGEKQAHRLMILVDDLDRCQPEATVSVLETVAIAILASDVPASVVAAMDADRAANAFLMVHHESDEKGGFERLTRVFSLMVQLPAIEPSGWRRIVEARFPELQRELGEDERTSLSTAVGLCCRSLRELKRRLNEVAFWWSIAAAVATPRPLPLHVILRWYFLTLQEPDLWEQLASDSEGLRETLRTSLDYPSIVATDVAGKLQQPWMRALMSRAILEVDTMKALGLIGQRLGSVRTLALGARRRPSALTVGQEKLSWTLLQVRASNAKNDEELAQVVRLSLMKKIEDLSDCIDCSNIAIECASRGLTRFSEPLIVKAVAALDQLIDSMPWKGTAEILSTYGDMLGKQDRIDEARRVFERIDFEHPEISPTSLARYVSFAARTKSLSLLDKLIDRLVKLPESEPELVGGAINTFLATGGAPAKAVSWMGELDLRFADDGRWLWTAADVCASLLIADAKREVISTEAFLRRANRAREKGLDQVKAYQSVGNLVRRLARIDVNLALEILDGLAVRGVMPDATEVLVLAEAKELQRDDRFKRLMNSVLSPLER